MKIKEGKLKAETLPDLVKCLLYIPSDKNEIRVAICTDGDITPLTTFKLRQYIKELLKEHEKLGREIWIANKKERCR